MAEKQNPRAEFGIRTVREIEKVYALAQEWDQKGTSKFPRMTYEEGIIAMIDYINGDVWINDEHPMK